MSWVVLILSGVCEAVWVIALSQSRGFKRLVPSLTFVIGLLVSLGGLAFAMQTLPTGTAYAVWVGIGAVTTVTVSMMRDEEPVTLARTGLILLLVASVSGLKVVS